MAAMRGWLGKLQMLPNRLIRSLTAISRSYCISHPRQLQSNFPRCPVQSLLQKAHRYSTLHTFINPSPKCGLGSFATGVRCLPTLNQIRREKPRTKNTQIKKYIPRSEKVMLGPQRKGVCVKVFIRKPKKPNSAQRKCALLKLSNGKTISAYIPGERGQLQEHGVVIFEGGRVQDCPGIKYKIIRRKLDMN